MKNAVVFGACSAIAQATAKIWASENANFVLVDQNQDHLQIVADDLKARGAQKVTTIAANLTHLDNHSKLIQQIQTILSTSHSLPRRSRVPLEAGLPTTYLFSYGTLGNQRKGQEDFADAFNELQINFISVVSLLTEIINTHQANTTNEATSSSSGNPLQQEQAILAVISSVAGDRGRQSNYIYGTAKGALTIWLQGLRNRLTKEDANIHVLTIKPGFVDTPMTKDFKKGLLWVKPERIAKDIDHAIRKKKDTIYTPWFWRYIMLIIRHIPETIFKKMSL